MPRARNIKPGFFKNEDLAECSLAARLCFAGLWILADREGRLEDRPKRIKAELFPFDSFEVEPLLVELSRRWFIFRYEVDGERFIQVSRFLAHQTPHYSEKKSVIKRPTLQDFVVDGGGTTPREAPELVGDEGEHTPREALENSKKERVIKRGSQPPDSPNPDSPNPDSPEAKASASPMPAAPLSAKDQLWAIGVPLLGEDKRPAIGRLVRTYGEEAVVEVLAQATLDRPIDPLAWITAALQSSKTRGKIRATKENGKHPEYATTQDLLDREPRPEWVVRAGFEDIFAAESAGCGPGNANKFRAGQRVVA